LGAIVRKRFRSGGIGAELLRREDIGDDEIIADAGADHMFLLGPDFGSPYMASIVRRMLTWVMRLRSGY
jgi:hypothetical protein